MWSFCPYLVLPGVVCFCFLSITPLFPNLLRCGSSLKPHNFVKGLLQVFSTFIAWLFLTQTIPRFSCASFPMEISYPVWMFGQCSTFVSWGSSRWVRVRAEDGRFYNKRWNRFGPDRESRVLFGIWSHTIRLKILPGAWGSGTIRL